MTKIRVCAACEKERGLLFLTSKIDNRSHGLCRRHFIKLLQSIGETEQEIQQAISEMKEPFVPDYMEGME